MADASSDPEKWKVFVVLWTGRKSGVLSLITDNWLKPAPKDLKPIIGQELNKLKAHVEAALEEKRKEIEAATEEAAAARDQIDLSLPGVERAIGTRHLIRQTFDELLRIFLSIGFSVVEGPEIETPYYNFEALNIPEHHPARDNMDTFYIEGARGGHLLRTHTSPVQIRTMLKQKPPIRIVAPGRVFRRDELDATHSPTFHQIEGLYVDKNVTVADLKGTVEFFFKQLLSPETEVRFRPHFFPYTEPSFEIDLSTPQFRARGKEWIEIAGCGMVNPRVLVACGIDPDRYSGFAFGLGIERTLMIRHGLADIRDTLEGDVRFSRAFGMEA
ncbi:MAG TPA: phenylalanine--tRNA ligase subunit alpha [Actinobacteria bacterium]|nr:phenylalanine--tRNA ligase subunit alpha [Actinomycetota bacterium]